MNTNTKKQICIRCSSEWREWLRAVTSVLDIPASSLIENSIASVALSYGFEPPPRIDRVRKESAFYKMSEEVDQKDITMCFSVNISCDAVWKNWVRNFAHSQGMTMFGLFEYALAQFAFKNNFPEPPARTTKYRTTLAG